ncbi:glutamine cyclotransferase [Bacteroidia bacterium]|nr:glutamine cyclotransferase [Bacteroidia bacterium]GHU54370.1 glutamine cyclotransferase [Bacteroidia bacterium]GHV03612.1 glutamine cyclotransferase [Bacteroidia bacterium]
MNTFKIFFIILSCALVSCANKGSSDYKPASAEQTVASPDFNADSAYLYIQNQVDFGPRVPNSPAHKACGDYLISELTRFGAKLYVQEMTLTAYNNEKLASRNIIGSFNPDSPKRILLFAHWDSRPYADNETDPAKQYTPIDGADDGGSGVGVLLEIARHLGEQAPNLGIDIIFFDAEDYGVPDFAKEYGKEDTWCLGTQFWAKNPHTPNYRANYGILLDMVGARNATFLKESLSVAKASSIVEKVWSTARNLGYGKYFINSKGSSLIDDHVYVIAGRNIPCIDIINYSSDYERGFVNHWHTLNDTMDNINRETLKAVGQTVLEVIYKQQ